MKTTSRIRTGVKAFIVYKGKVLVIKERVHRDIGDQIIHDVPGGGIELGESLEEALVREVMEEVGLRIQVGRPVGGWGFFVDKGDETVHIVCLGFQCSLLGQSKIDTTNNPAHNEDIFEAVWMSREDILQSDTIFENGDMRKSLENVRMF